jgi:hypothetical protein
MADGTYTISEALALAERVHSERGFMLGLFGPTGGYWYAEFIDPLHPERTTPLSYMSAESCAEAIRLAAEQIAEVSGSVV